MFLRVTTKMCTLIIYRLVWHIWSKAKKMRLERERERESGKRGHKLLKPRHAIIQQQTHKHDKSFVSFFVLVFFVVVFFWFGCAVAYKPFRFERCVYVCRWCSVVSPKIQLAPNFACAKCSMSYVLSPHCVLLLLLLLFFFCRCFSSVVWPSTGSELECGNLFTCDSLCMCCFFLFVFISFLSRHRCCLRTHLAV